MTVHPITPQSITPPDSTPPDATPPVAPDDALAGPLPGAQVVASEFAQVAVSLDLDANGVRLRLQDLRTGRVRCLDALELETIVWLRDEHMSALLDPSADRWRDDS